MASLSSDRKTVNSSTGLISKETGYERMGKADETRKTIMEALNKGLRQNKIDEETIEAIRNSRPKFAWLYSVGFTCVGFACIALGNALSNALGKELSAARQKFLDDLRSAGCNCRSGPENPLPAPCAGSDNGPTGINTR